MSMGDIGSIGSAIAAIIGLWVSWTVYRGQQQLAQRQLIIPLWDYMSNLKEIDSKNPITPDVIKVVNTLELVALCCEGGMVDKAVIKRTFQGQFLKHYENIQRCGALPGLNEKTGSDILNENQAARNFYDELDKARKTQGQLSS